MENKIQVCQATGANSYKCLCEYGFYGTRCESYSIKDLHPKCLFKKTRLTRFYNEKEIQKEPY